MKFGQDGNNHNKEFQNLYLENYFIDPVILIEKLFVHNFKVFFELCGTSCSI